MKICWVNLAWNCYAVTSLLGQLNINLIPGQTAIVGNFFVNFHLCKVIDAKNDIQIGPRTQLQIDRWFILNNLPQNKLIHLSYLLIFSHNLGKIENNLHNLFLNVACSVNHGL